MSWDIFTDAWTYIFMVGVWIVSFFIRTAVETRWPTLKKQAHENEEGPTYLSPAAMWWNKIGLYLVPTLLGMGMAAAVEMFPYPDKIVSLGGRVFFGMITGFFCVYGYKVIAFVVMKKWEAKFGKPVELPEAGPPPLE